jgi:uncharacterized protein
MKVVELNLLICAINESSPHHEKLKALWEGLLNGDESVGLGWTVLLGFLRLTTHPKIFPTPLSVESATDMIDDWLEAPVVSTIETKPEHWSVLRALLAETGAAGNLTTDAHLAALAITHDAVLVSCDNDFSRFPGLRFQNPLRG